MAVGAYAKLLGDTGKLFNWAVIDVYKRQGISIYISYMPTTRRVKITLVNPQN